MKLKAPEFQINTGAPFENDRQSRENTAENITALLKIIDDPMVLCINAPWGSGKTTFLKMWKHALDKEGFKTLYFSAWENDFTDNALASLPVCR